jgi:hypothetical protein
MKKHINLFCILLVAVGLSSCIKQDPTFNPAQSNAVVQLGDPSSINVFASTAFPYNVYNQSFDIVPSVVYNIPVMYTGGDNAPQDITVTLAFNQAALDAFNIYQGYPLTAPGYIPPSSALATIPSYTVVIPKGQKTAYLPITFKTTSFSFSTGYAYAFTIQSASYGVISSNFKTAIYVVGAKNAYEANYTTSGYLFHPSSPRALSGTKYVYTLGLNTCYEGVGDLGGSNYYFQFDISGSTITNYVPIGSTPAVPASGLMSADYPSPSGSNGFPSAAPLSPGTAPYTVATYNNTYVAASKTFFLHYGYASGGNGQSTFTRVVYEKLVRQ